MDIQPGYEESGYRYKGGDPGSRDSWEPIQQREQIKQPAPELTSGYIEDGYRFRGGDPSKRGNWLQLEDPGLFSKNSAKYKQQATMYGDDATIAALSDLEKRAAALRFTPDPGNADDMAVYKLAMKKYGDDYDRFVQFREANKKKQAQINRGEYQDRAHGLLGRAYEKLPDGNNAPTVTRLKDGATYYKHTRTPGWYFPDGSHAPDAVSGGVTITPTESETNYSKANRQESLRRLSASTPSMPGLSDIANDVKEGIGPMASLTKAGVGIVSGAIGMAGAAMRGVAGLSKQELGLDDTYKDSDFNKGFWTNVEGKQVLMRSGDGAYRMEDGPSGPGWYKQEPTGKWTKQKLYLAPEDTYSGRVKAAREKEMRSAKKAQDILDNSYAIKAGNVEFDIEQGVKRLMYGAAGMAGSMLQSDKITDWADKGSEGIKYLDEMAAQQMEQEDPDSWSGMAKAFMLRNGADYASGLAANAALMAASAGVAGLTARSLSLMGASDSAATAISQFISTMPEAASEAFSAKKEAYRRLLDAGYSDAEARVLADKAWSKAFALNVGMLYASNKADMGLDSFLINEQIEKQTRKALAEAARETKSLGILKRIGQESTEEGVQGAITAVSTARPDESAVTTATRAAKEGVTSAIESLPQVAIMGWASGSKKTLWSKSEAAKAKQSESDAKFAEQALRASESEDVMTETTPSDTVTHPTVIEQRYNDAKARVEERRRALQEAEASAASKPKSVEALAQKVLLRKEQLRVAELSMHYAELARQKASGRESIAMGDGTDVAAEGQVSPTQGEAVAVTTAARDGLSKIQDQMTDTVLKMRQEARDEKTVAQLEEMRATDPRAILGFAEAIHSPTFEQDMLDMGLDPQTVETVVAGYAKLEELESKRIAYSDAASHTAEAVTTAKDTEIPKQALAKDQASKASDVYIENGRTGDSLITKIKDFNTGKSIQESSQRSLFSESELTPEKSISSTGEGIVLGSGISDDEFWSNIEQSFGKKVAGNLKKSNIVELINSNRAEELGMRGARGVAINKRVAKFVTNTIGGVNDAVELVLHEVGGHIGLRAMLGEEGWSEVKQMISRTVRKPGVAQDIWKDRLAIYQSEGERDIKSGIKNSPYASLVGIESDNYPELFKNDTFVEEFFNVYGGKIDVKTNSLFNRVVLGIKAWWNRTFGGYLTQDQATYLLFKSTKQAAERAMREYERDSKSMQEAQDFYSDKMIEQARAAYVANRKGVVLAEKSLSDLIDPKLKQRIETPNKVEIQGSMRDYRKQFGWLTRSMFPRSAMQFRSQLVRDLSNKIDDYTSRIVEVKNEGRELQALLAEQFKLGNDRKLGYMLGAASNRKNADGTMGRRFTEAEIRHFFPGIEQSMVDAYNMASDIMERLTDTLIGSFEEHNKQVAEKIKARFEGSENQQAMTEALKENNENLSRIKEALSNKAYWPFKRWGNFKTDIVNSETGEVIATIMHDHTGEKGTAEIAAKLGEIRLQSSQAREAVDGNKIKALDPVPLPKNSEVHAAGFNTIDEAMGSYLTSASKIDPDSAKAIELAVLNAKMAGDIKKHLSYKRQGIAGWETSALKVFETHLAEVANRVAANEKGVALNDQIKQFGYKERGAKYDPTLETEAMSMVRDAMNPPAHEIANKITTIGFIKHIGLSPAFALVNKLQIPSIAIPTLSTFYNAKDVVKSIAKAEIMAANVVGIDRLDAFDDSHENAIRRLSKIDDKQIDSFTGVDGSAKRVKDLVVNAIRSGALKTEASFGVDEHIGNRILDAAVKISGVFASKTEQSNRLSMLLATGMLFEKHGAIRFDDEKGWLLDKGMSARDVVASADLLNDAVNIIRGRGKQPKYLRARGSMGEALALMFNYKSFALGSVSLFHSLGLLNASKESGRAAKAWAYAKPQLANMTVAFMLGGPTAYIWFSILSMLLPKEWVAELWDMSAQLIRRKVKGAGISMFGMSEKEAESFSRRFSYMVGNGLIPNMAGVDISGSMNASLISEGRTRDETMLKSMMGASLSNAYEIASRVADGDMQGARQKMGLRFWSPLESAISGKVSIGAGKKESITTGERALYAAGMTPSRVATLRESNQESFEFTDRTKKFLDRIKKELTQNARKQEDGMPTQDAIDKARKEVEAYNARNNKYFERYNAKKLKSNDIRKVINGLKFSERKKEWIFGEAGVERIGE